jgi:hypothetical protein
MTESLTLNKLAVLKRAVVGGLLSALATGIPMFIGHFLESQSINLLLSIFLKSFALPGVIISYPIHDPYGPPGLSLFQILLSLLYWSLFGFGLSLFIKDNGRAIGCWLWLVLIPSIVFTLLVYSVAGAFQ